MDYPRDIAIPACIPCEIVGFEDVAGRGAARVSAERHLNNQEVQRHMALRSARLKKLEQDRASGYDADAALKRSLKYAREEEVTQDWHMYAFVNLNTGITLRQQLKVITHERNTPVAQMDFFVLQLFES